MTDKKKTSNKKKMTGKFKIVNKLGLHTRPAAKFVKAALLFQSDVTLAKDDIVANGKSIMGILMLAAEKGSTVTLTVTGPDEAQAFETLKKIIQNGFDE